MKVSRRRFLAAGALLSAGSAGLSACATSGKTDSSATTSAGSAGANFSVAQTQATLTDFLNQQGYSPTAAASLITGIDYNGGLRFDDGTLSDPSTYVVQPAARVHDVTEKSKPGILPIFTILALTTPNPAQAPKTLDLYLHALTSVVGLDPSRLRVTTTSLAAPFYSALAAHGIQSDQIRLRNLSEAKQSGTGSGYFAPVGHPSGQGFPTFSVEHVLPDGTEIEIGEYGFDSGNSNIGTGFGVGLERVTMARNDLVTSWGDSLTDFKTAVMDDAAKNGMPLPSGYTIIMG